MDRFSGPVDRVAEQRPTHGRAADLHELVNELPEEAPRGAAFLLERLLRGQLDADQAWVWTAEWQEQLRSSLADVEAGRTQRFSTSEEFLASL